MPGRLGSWLLGAGIVLAALIALLLSADAPAPVGRGAPAPAFELPALGGGPPVGIEQLRGEIVLLNFWATWCEPCKEEMPAMERLYRAIGGRDFELLAVSVDEDQATVEAFVKQLGITFPVLLDASKQVATTYQTFRYPESLLIGRDGVILERYVGPKDWDADAYRDRIQRLLAESAAG